MAAVIACTPIVWLHYFSLLLVVVAVASPRLSPVWFVPLAMWGAEEVANGTTFQTGLAIGAAALTVGLALKPLPPLWRSLGRLGGRRPPPDHRDAIVGVDGRAPGSARKSSTCEDGSCCVSKRTIW